MIVNISKLYGLPEKIIIRRTQVRSLVYFFLQILEGQPSMIHYFFYCSYFYSINGENLSYPLFLNSYNCKLWYILFRPSLFFSIEIGDP